MFDRMTKDDLIIAFFPCIYFSCMSQMLMSFTHRNYVNYTTKERCEAILERSSMRELYFSRAVKLIGVVMDKGLRLIMENPWSEQTFLKQNFVMKPAIIDTDRTLRGDYYVKPTAFWFIGCTPTNGRTYKPRQRGKNICEIDPNRKPGLCNEERSMISPDYARNFICDFVIGKEQVGTQLSIF